LDYRSQLRRAAQGGGVDQSTLSLALRAEGVYFNNEIRQNWVKHGYSKPSKSEDFQNFIFQVEVQYLNVIERLRLAGLSPSLPFLSMACHGKRGSSEMTVTITTISTRNRCQEGDLI
jgi:hypothetical protein